MDSNDQYARSIELPTQKFFRNIKNVKKFAIDIGGSLAKVVYLSEVGYKRPRHYTPTCETSSEDIITNDDQQPLYRVEEHLERSERLHFIKFETKYIEDCLDFIQKNVLSQDCRFANKLLPATGGGAHKYKDLITKKLNMTVNKLDEMQCLITGCNFLLQNVPNESYQFKLDANDEPEFQFKNLAGDNIFPYLLVNIGSGVSIIKVESAKDFERIGGTSTGGGTFWGLGSLLTNAKGFDELLAMASEGKTKNIDMLVKDIYGGAYSEIGLPGDLTASSFGKAARNSRDNTAKNDQFRSQDIVKALLRMISNDIGQISSLYAQLHGLNRVYFGGYFLRGHSVSMNTISYAVNFFSKGKQQALFLRHEGYLGAIGAFVDSVGNLDTSWRENYAGSSGLSTDYTRKVSVDQKLDIFELDSTNLSFNVCPLLLNSSTYNPDLIDLGLEEEARDYWLDTFEKGIDSFMNQAISSQPNQSNATDRGNSFKEDFIERLNTLRKIPYKFGKLTVRSLLDTREQFLVSHSFCDPYLQVKQKENELALKVLPARLKFIDGLCSTERQVEVVIGLVAGNVFDWGATAIQRCLKDTQFGFEEAKNKIKQRPWFCDDVDEWINRMNGNRRHELAVIFVDNSGADIVLGVFPFVREFLKNGTKVIIAANSFPSINDVIFSELDIVALRIAEICPIIRSSLDRGKLKIMETGSNSACLDLRRIDVHLAETMKLADLIVLEGMGRCIHTNFDAKFSCESIRCAVLKNKWLAKRLGTELFDVVFKYIQP